MKRKHIVIKTFFQISLYVVELLSVSLFLTCLTTFIEPINSCIVFLERIVLTYSMYQILVIVILSNLNDIQKDFYLAWMTTLKLTLVYLETEDKSVKKMINLNIKYQLDDSTFNSITLRNAYKNLQQNLDQVTQTSIKFELILAEQQYELQSLNWKFSFILRLPFLK